MGFCWRPLIPLEILLLPTFLINSARCSGVSSRPGKMSESAIAVSEDNFGSFLVAIASEKSISR